MANSDSIKTLKVRFHSFVGLLVTFELMVVCKKVLCFFSAQLCCRIRCFRATEADFTGIQTLVGAIWL